MISHQFPPFVSAAQKTSLEQPRQRMLLFWNEPRSISPNWRSCHPRWEAAGSSSSSLVSCSGTAEAPRGQQQHPWRLR